jgi:hypothetical protein
LRSNDVIADDTVRPWTTIDLAAIAHISALAIDLLNSIPIAENGLSQLTTGLTIAPS